MIDKRRVLRTAALLALGDPAVRLLGRVYRDRSPALDPQVAAVLALQRLLRIRPLESMPPIEARQFAEDGLAPLDVLPEPMARVIDVRAAGLPARIYVPHDASPHGIIYFHGGGGVIGSIRSAEPVTRLLAAQTGCVVASVDYRLGPEHRHPAAIEDAIAAYDALVPRVRGRIAVAGDSFGGFLAAHVDRAAARRPDLQVLIYPLVDLTHGSPSIERWADGYLLTRTMIDWFHGHYLRPHDDLHGPSPLSWDALDGAAPAIVVTAGHDPLVDEGDAYADRLRAAGVPVIHRRFDPLIHGFLSLAGGVRAARAAVDAICADIRDIFAPVRRA